MPTLYCYQPSITTGPNGTDYRPTTNSNENSLTELCELEGLRYVVVPDDITVMVPEEITTWEQVTLTGQLRDRIKLVSSHCNLARTRCIDAIRANHSLDDELYYARIATGITLGTYQLLPRETEILLKYQQDVELARTNLHQEYAKLGL